MLLSFSTSLQLRQIYVLLIIVFVRTVYPKASFFLFDKLNSTC